MTDTSTTAPVVVKEHSHGAGASRPAPDESRAARLTSYDVNDFAVPTGREEEWRFTPLDRLRGLHESATGEGKVVVEVDAAPEVTVESVRRDDPRLGRAGKPGDRVAAQAWSSFETATVVTVAPEVVTSRPTVVTFAARGRADRRTATPSSR